MPNALKTTRERENDAEKLKFALEYLRDEATRMDLGLVAASIEKALQILNDSRLCAKTKKTLHS